ncbi:hypothetical protein Tco_1288007, partial [Tanacetum coccineum]
VQSAANTLPENIENTPKIPKEVEPSPPTPELVVEEPVEETMVDVPAPAEEAHLLKSQWQRSQNKKPWSMLLPQLRIHQPLKSQLRPRPKWWTCLKVRSKNQRQRQLQKKCRQLRKLKKKLRL